MRLHHADCRNSGREFAKRGTPLQSSDRVQEPWVNRDTSQMGILRVSLLPMLHSPYSNGYGRYFIARNWSEVSTAVLSSIPASNLDDMVTLYQGYFDRRTTKVTAGVRVITWQTNLDLMRQLMIGGRPSILAPYLEAHTTTGGYSESLRLLLRPIPFHHPDFR